MPPRLERRQQAGHIHFITFSCHDRSPYMATSVAKEVFLNTLESVRKRYDFSILGYVVMPEHIHLLLSEPNLKPLNVALAVIKRSVSHKRPETPFWLPRYYDFNIFTQAKRVEKLRYIHRNPVSRGLAEKPEDYSWSSFRTYSLHEPGLVTITQIA